MGQRRETTLIAGRFSWFWPGGNAGSCFGAEGKAEQFVVVPSDHLRGLDTVIVAPLDVDGPLYDADRWSCASL